MPLPDSAALNRIHAILLKRRAGTLDLMETVAEIEIVMEATKREFIDDSSAFSRMDLIDYLEKHDARFDPPDADGRVWAHYTEGGIQRSVNVSADDPGATLGILKLGKP